jgi:acyl-coenzyme A thioesterase PaaI-like protein
MMDSRDTDRGRVFHQDCFACGLKNRAGLRMQFATNGNWNTSTVVIDKRFQGYDSIAQGGIVATILDTAMVRLLHDLCGGNPMTGRLEVRYHAATPLHSPVTVTAHLTGRRGNACWAEAGIFHGTARCATARGTFKITFDK